MMSIKGKRVYLHFFFVDLVSKETLFLNFRRIIHGRGKVFVVTPYATFYRWAEINMPFRDALNSADIAIPDSMGILIGSLMLSLNLPTNKLKRLVFLVLHWVYYSLLAIASSLESTFGVKRIPGVDLTSDLFAFAEKNELSVYVLGGWKESLERLDKILLRQHPKLKYKLNFDIADVVIREEDSLELREKIFRDIDSFQPNILLVAFGPPFQEIWVHKNYKNLHANIIITVGATIDLLSGTLERAPKWLRNIGFEWLWRLITQPTRLKRIFFAFPYFPAKLILKTLKDS